MCFHFVVLIPVSYTHLDVYKRQLQSGAVINVEDVEVDNNALEQALKQIIDDHCLTQSAQRVCIRKFTVRQDDYEKLIGSNFFSAKLKMCIRDRS